MAAKIGIINNSNNKFYIHFTNLLNYVNILLKYTFNRCFLVFNGIYRNIVDILTYKTNCYDFKLCCCR